LTLSFKELAENFKTLQTKHAQELKTLECKQKLEKDKLLFKQHEEMQEVKLSDYFKIGDNIALDKVDYLPTTHHTETYMIRAIGADYIVCFNEKLFENELITWADLFEAEKLYRNGEEIAERADLK